jgi:hypothetical protein
MKWSTIALILLAFIVVLAIIIGIALLIPTNMM